MIRAVSFDIDDTLYDFTLVSHRALGFVAGKMREAAGPAGAALNVETVIYDLEACAVEMNHPYAQIPELQKHAFARTLRRVGVCRPDLLGELRRIYLRHRFEDIIPFEGMVDALKLLEERYTLCAVSNGEQELRLLGVEGLFEFVILASDLGYRKPDERIFRKAIEWAGCLPEEFVHVGDSLKSDVAGAKAVGAWAIWFNPSGRSLDDGIIPDKEVRSLAELPRVLHELETKSDSC